MALDNNQLRTTIVTALKSLGYELWGFELGTGGRRLLIRVFIDAANGITIDDCALASRQINAMIEVEMPELADYALEVSSPGLERPLYTIEQFTKYIGETIQVRTSQMYEGRRNFIGKLQSVMPDNTVVINVDKIEYSLAFADIEKAKLLYLPPANLRAGAKNSSRRGLPQKVNQKAKKHRPQQRESDEG